MTTRVVIFKGQTGWLQTPEFNGDKDELAQASATLSCDKNWRMIARRFIQAKTKEEFAEASAWAQSLYHNSACETKPAEIREFKRPDETVDETLVVYEDLGVSGIHAIGVCPTCGRSHVIWYRPDKTVSSPGMKCLTCAARLRVYEPLPSQEEWTKAIDMYQMPAPSFRLATPDDFPHIAQKLKEYTAAKQEPELTGEQLAAASYGWLGEEMGSDIAANHMGEPVKIAKIVQYTGGEFRFEIMFKDWSTAVVRSRYLIPLKKPE